jgi:DNA polymerase-3 subunit chi
MTEVWFYHLTYSHLKDVLPELMEKTLEKGWKAYVHMDENRSFKDLSDALWSHKNDSFIAHDIEGNVNDNRQPILFGAKGLNVNDAQIYMSISPVQWLDLKAYLRALFIFDDNDQSHVLWARRAWKILKNEGHEMAFWKQMESGKWQKQNLT